MKTLFNQGARDTPTECQSLKILHSEEQRVSLLQLQLQFEAWSVHGTDCVVLPKVCGR